MDTRYWQGKHLLPGSDPSPKLWHFQVTLTTLPDGPPSRAVSCPVSRLRSSFSRRVGRHRLPASSKEAGPACLGFVASGMRTGREWAFDEITRIAYRDPSTGVVPSPGYLVVREARLA